MHTHKSYRSVGEVAAEYIRVVFNPNPKIGIKTGFNHIDDMSEGLQPGSISIIAARPSLGKTTLALNMAENIVIKQKLPTAYISFEMEDTDCVQRILSSLTGVDQHKLRLGDCSKDEIVAIQDVTSSIYETPLYISSPSLSVTELCQHIELLHDELGVEVVMVDYLQLVDNSYLNESGELESDLDSILKLKKLAVRLNLAIVVLSQLPRSIHGRANKRPVLSDLPKSKISGDIEKHASLVIFIYRDAVYNENSQNKNAAEINVAKNDFGAVGTISFLFNDSELKFQEC